LEKYKRKLFQKSQFFYLFGARMVEEWSYG